MRIHPALEGAAAEENERILRLNFGRDRRWRTIEGLVSQPGSKPEDHLISITGRDHNGAAVAFWTDLPNAMYLLSCLAQVQKETGASVQVEPPKPCKSLDDA